MELGGRPQHYSICNMTMDNNPVRLEASGSTLSAIKRLTPFLCSYLHGTGGIQDELAERSDMYSWIFHG